MTAKLMWTGCLVLAVVVVVGCRSKTADTHDHGSHAAHDESSHGPTERPSAANAQTICPVLGGKINKSIYADHIGKRVYFCCEGCIDTFNKDPMKYIKKLEDAGIVLDKTPSGSGHGGM